MDDIHRKRDKTLGIPELIAIALGGMVGGGIFTILGISVSMIGAYTPFAIILGGIVAALAAYSYIKLGVYYQDEGATYSFFKRTFPNSAFAASLIGWWVIFGYISTLSLYAYTFSSYALSSFSYANDEIIRKLVAGVVIFVFTLINLWSVKGMGKIEDLMVYTKLVILIIISFVLINHSNTTIPNLLNESKDVEFSAILIVASITFVAYEGFQLVINAVNEMDNPQKNIPIAIYSAIALAILLYVVISFGAILAISFDDIIANKEYALASGANKVLGHWGNDLVIIGALLATSSAISGTLFGASRQMSIVAKDGFFPKFLEKRNIYNIPTNSILMMSFLAFCLILSGSLKLILEFGSVTFLIVSLLMAIANFKIRDKTDSSFFITILAIVLLLASTILIIFYEFQVEMEQMFFIVFLYVVLTFLSWIYSKRK
ncbi:MAG: APC family permease [Arcobacter sp.]|jgi:amino acid transporter|uniref:Amino acid permease n=1 Tax=Arcobacter defluvii TaxID=873191 RepID=A0AAE7BD01_9BACT|nr:MULTISPECIES: APC family permease [Arcobacter]QKF77145.1 amino acid permease [Arcobacter defluvii]RXI33563.1 amino acid permease [Arcobacter defluvii]BAK73042.1 amino acid transport protein [Arcobacter sp. L]